MRNPDLGHLMTQAFRAITVGSVAAPRHKLATSSKRPYRTMADFCGFQRVALCGKKHLKRPDAN